MLKRKRSIFKAASLNKDKIKKQLQDLFANYSTQLSQATLEDSIEVPTSDLSSSQQGLLGNQLWNIVSDRDGFSIVDPTNKTIMFGYSESNIQNSRKEDNLQLFKILEEIKQSFRLTINSKLVDNFPKGVDELITDYVLGPKLK